MNTRGGSSAVDPGDIGPHGPGGAGAGRRAARRAPSGRNPPACARSGSGPGGSFGRAGWQPRDVQAVIVSRGPGSYTGLRVGIISAKTFAYATGCDLLAVDTFAALALQAPASVRARRCRGGCPARQGVRAIVPALGGRLASVVGACDPSGGRVARRAASERLGDGSGIAQVGGSVAGGCADRGGELVGAAAGESAATLAWRVTGRESATMRGRWSRCICGPVRRRNSGERGRRERGLFRAKVGQPMLDSGGSSGYRSVRAFALPEPRE